ncbi:hypothetical protein K493DRAFT_319190 [Basidiobolus meristosporus CBS 931.73]|uniref:Uncharacterized protein n=1 Tax=Basidiobolus meristosporus CBS 931.73 TaxID=1314790 RepID=A0A1Y1XSY9_9FUNG|nr:hypothetical protein K493DRAFT_319190 [Basidiobolus meristosporus CBS 931.73]|eukprot:ORX88805.1 hypothetical protein K493DRAFT_319190 [Basidiobolus meristosporus CBS 931.73]
MSSPESGSGDREAKNPPSETRKNLHPEAQVYVPRFKRMGQDGQAKPSPQSNEPKLDTNKPKSPTPATGECPPPRRGRDFDATSLRVYPETTAKKTPQKNSRNAHKGSSSHTSHRQDRSPRGRPSSPNKPFPERKPTPGAAATDPTPSSSTALLHPEPKLGRRRQVPEPGIDELTKSLGQLSTEDAHPGEKFDKAPSTPVRVPAPGRPVTSDMVARRLVGNILGIKVTKSKEALEQEKKKLAEARAQRLAKKKEEAKRLEESERTFLE